MQLKKREGPQATVEFEGRSYRNFNSEQFKEDLLRERWEVFYQIKDTDKAWDYLLGRIETVIDKMCPLRKFRIKNYRPEWVTDELIEQIKDRDYFYYKAKCTDNEDYWNIAKHLRNRTNANIRSAKKDFIINELNENDSSCKKFWDNIRQVMPNDKGNSRNEIVLKDKDGYMERSEVAHYINEFFINVGNPDPGARQAETDNVCPDHEDLWSIHPFTVNEVFKMIKDINVSKSSGLHNLSSFIVKEAFTVLVEVVTYLFNLSISSSKFPKAWKDALVIPIPKSGDLSKVQNFRPISLLPLPGKLLEKLVHKQLSEHLESKSLLTDVQHGFRKSHSTVHAVAQFTNYVNTKRDLGTPTLALYVDFRKAFDCVQYSVLLRKLAELGLNQGTLEWMESYLSDRRQRVLANDHLSPFQSIKQGVPQGSVLGPLFYIIYANDLEKYLKCCKIALYADDTVLYTANRNFGRSVELLQKDVNALGEWCNLNGIKANTNKTKLMVFGSHKRVQELPDFEINLDNTPLQKVTSYKYLGVTLDPQLKLDKHVQNTVNIVSGKLYQFRRMRSFLNEEAALLVYKNMLLPMLEYGDIILNGITATQKKRLQGLQNKGLRCALKRKQDSSTAVLHEDANLLKLKFRRQQHVLNFMFDMSQQDASMKPARKVGVSTRQGNKRLMKLRRPKTERFKKCLAYVGPKQWNGLPEKFHFITTKPPYKSQVALLVKQRAVAEGLKQGEC